jgi:membrane fusion protein (multidrug efflux system)
MYVRARVEQAVSEKAIVVPQQAVQRDVNGSSVFVAGADNKVEVRPVKTEAARDNQWIVSKGLKPGDRVIVEGFQKLGPGAPVKPVPWKPARTDQPGQARAAANK